MFYLKLSSLRTCMKPLMYHENISASLFTKVYTSISSRLYCDKKGDKPPDDDDVLKQKSDNLGFDSKYIAFKDADAPVLLDVYEEKIQLEQSSNHLEEEEDEFFGISLQRGQRGVFDLDHLVNLLRREKAQDVFVAQLPPEVRYVDYIVVVSGRSRRHMLALAEIVRRVYKKKRWPTDSIPHIEGEKSSDWMALDLGNIALHIFSEEARVVYDLESLWSVGPKFDPLVNAPVDPLISLLNKHAIPLKDLEDKGQLQ